MKLARVTITRPQGSRSGESSIAITIEDEDSRLTVLRVEMTLADFASCVTGHGHMPAKVEHWIGKHVVNVGKTLEVRTVLLTGRPPHEKKAAAKWVREHPELNHQTVDGWTIGDDGTGSQQNAQDKHYISLRRYVEAPANGQLAEKAGNGGKTV